MIIKKKSLSKIRPFYPIIISFILLSAIGIWFKNTYGEKPISILQILKPETSASYFIKAKDSVLLNRPFTIDVVMDTKGHSVNAIGLQLLYQKDSLKVLGIDTTESFCQFYPDKKIDDTLGLITLSCGSPNPGFTGENTVIKIEFQPTKIGPTTLTIKDTSKILLSDGKGTNILSEFPQKKLNVSNNL